VSKEEDLCCDFLKSSPAAAVVASAVYPAVNRWNNGTRFPLKGMFIDTGTVPTGSTWARYTRISAVDSFSKSADPFKFPVQEPGAAAGRGLAQRWLEGIYSTYKCT